MSVPEEAHVGAISLQLTVQAYVLIPGYFVVRKWSILRCKTCGLEQRELMFLDLQR